MKKFFLIFITFLPLIASAQMDRFFYGNKWSDLQAFGDSLLKALPGYRLDSTVNNKQADAVFLCFSNQAKQRLAVKVYKVIENDLVSIGTAEIKGHYNPLYDIYKYYFNSSPVLQNTNCFPEIRKARFRDKIVSVSFCPMSNTIWLLLNRKPL